MLVHPWKNCILENFCNFGTIDRSVFLEHSRFHFWSWAQIRPRSIQIQNFQCWVLLHFYLCSYKILIEYQTWWVNLASVLSIAWMIEKRSIIHSNASSKDPSFSDFHSLLISSICSHIEGFKHKSVKRRLKLWLWNTLLCFQDRPSKFWRFR